MNTKFLPISFYLALLPVYNALAQSTALEVQQYTLANGLTVYLNSDPTANQVYGAVVIKAGSKNDPANATGMAHYLEHMLFKGTEDLGTTDYDGEKPYLDSINMFYDSLGKTTDKTKRAEIQQRINALSVQASVYALPTEFDKLVKRIGGTDLNAFTTEDMTVYHNAFPGEQMDKWLQLYSHRFQNPVFRSFQTELEVVYEEKNQSMDGLGSILFEEINRNLYKYHPYGTQTTIGTVEHLKNPSLTKMYDYFNTYYVANNMALILCGNFDIDLAIPIIDIHFSQLKSGVIPEFPTFPPTVFTKNEMVKVHYTPVRLSVMGFKSIPAFHPDKPALQIAMSLLYNEAETGRLNKLGREHKLLYALALNNHLSDDGAIILLLWPKLIGQSFDKAEKLVNDEIDRLRRGEFTKDELAIVKTELYRQHQLSLENYESRLFQIASLFGNSSTWDYYLNYSNELDAISREDVMRVVDKYLGAHHFTLRSGRGHPPKTTLDKPGFQPVPSDQTGSSRFAQAFDSVRVSPASPQFIDVEKDAKKAQMNASNLLFVVPNPVNEVFNLSIHFKVGTDSIKNLELAANLTSYFHPKDIDIDSFKLAMARLGLTHYASADRNTMNWRFTGLEKNLEASIQIIAKIVYEPYLDESVMKILRDEMKAERKFELKDPYTVGDALFEFAVYASRSSYLDRIELKAFNKLNAESLLSIYRKSIEYNAVWHFVGQTSTDSVTTLLLHYITPANNQKACEPTVLPITQTQENLIYLTHDKKAIQSHMYFTIPTTDYTYTPSSKSKLQAFNDYIGGDFSGIIMQEIREYRSLAYTAYGNLIMPYFEGKSGYFLAYIGCQSDKTNDATQVMINIVDSMPLKPERMGTIRDGMKNSAARKYPNFRYLSMYLENRMTYGDILLFSPEEYASYDSLTFSDLEAMYVAHVRNRPIIITISGNTSKMNTTDLASYGRIVHIKKKRLFTSNANFTEY